MQAAEGVTRFEDQGVVNWYLVETDDGKVAVDAAFPTAWEQVEPHLADLRAIVITHAHVDHLGFAEKARQEAGVQVYVPEADAQLARHPLRYAKSERVPLLYLRHLPTVRLYWRALKAGAMRGKALRDFRTYRNGDSLPGGLRAVATPGHTDGHMALHLADRSVLFAGDAIAATGATTLLSGHGPAWTEGAAEAAELARQAGAA